MIQCNKGTLGKPFFNKNDFIGFYLANTKGEEKRFFIGTVYIVDSYGTFEQNEEPSYDIFVEHFFNGEKCLVKHIRESSCYILEPEDICSNCNNRLGDALCEDEDGNFYSPCDKCNVKRR